MKGVEVVTVGLGIERKIPFKKHFSKIYFEREGKGEEKESD